VTSLGRTKFQDVSLSLLRIAGGLIFWQHGAQKLFGWLGGEQVELVSLMGLAGVLEFFGGILILVGLFTRPVAFVLSGEMAVAYFMAHQPRGLMPIQNGGELAALFAFLFLMLSAFGPGSLSLDDLRSGGGADAAPGSATGGGGTSASSGV
jgi:putative oxidoreductase